MQGVELVDRWLYGREKVFRSWAPSTKRRVTEITTPVC